MCSLLQDEETVKEACWALFYLTDGPNERIQAVLDIGVAPRLIELLHHPSVDVQTPALRAVGNFVTGDEAQTQFIVNLNVMAALSALLGKLLHAFYCPCFVCKIGLI